MRGQLERLALPPAGDDTMRTYRTEFPDFDPATMPIIPAWLDTSWHNDTCPSFQSETVRIFIDYADPQQREIAESVRYSVHANDNAMADVLFYADDWLAILAFVDAYEGRAA